MGAGVGGVDGYGLEVGSSDGAEVGTVVGLGEVGTVVGTGDGRGDGRIVVGTVDGRGDGASVGEVVGGKGWHAQPQPSSVNDPPGQSLPHAQ